MERHEQERLRSIPKESMSLPGDERKQPCFVSIAVWLV